LIVIKINLGNFLNMKKSENTIDLLESKKLRDTTSIVIYKNEDS